MGGKQSYPKGLSEDILDDYVALTYLSKGEILYLIKKFTKMNPVKIQANYLHRFSRTDILDNFTVLQNNPFQDRLFAVFSSHNDDRFSLEDMIDLCSAMSSECPDEVKASWAFRIFDIDEDNQISEEDISQIIDRLTWDMQNPRNVLDSRSKRKIADIILNEVKMDRSGSIGFNEFKIMASRIPDFKTSFYFRL